MILDLAEYIVIKKERPAMNRNQSEVNPVEIQIK